MSNKIPSAIPRYLQTKQYLETDMDVVMPPLTPKKRYAPKLTDTQLSDSVCDLYIYIYIPICYISFILIFRLINIYYYM